MVFVTAALVLQLELVRHSLTGTHYRFRSPEGEVNVTVRPDGRIESFGAPVSALPPLPEEETVTTNPFLAPHAFALKSARVFDANPIKKLNNPALEDQNNSAAAVPDAAYTTVDLDDVNASGPLGGPYCQIVDEQPPSIAPVDASGSLMSDRSQPAFEDVNAYFHVDRSQKYLQSLGYLGARGIAQYPVPVDTHAANGADTSFFVPSMTAGQGMLIFGDGGTDDAEDPDLVVHEYAHAIHESIAPGSFLGPFASEGRAISEGFADYWGFSASYAAALQSGRDPFCFADWDARCAGDASSEQCGYPAGANCLRRLDSPKTVADFDHNDNSGTQYVNGEIWSSALREIFIALTHRYGNDAGKRVADTIAVESLFGAPPDPSFAGIARKMIAADQYLSRGANADVICAAMTARGILTDCVTAPRGELTVFESGARGVAIPDNDTSGVTVSTVVSDPRAIDKLYVQVNIAHPNRGDLQMTLIAPDGTEVQLKQQSNDRTADIRATYGRDSLPLQPLDVFRGRSAAGEWRLRISDVRPRDAGTLLSWSLVVQFAGDSPSATRPTGSMRQFIPIVGRVPGANETFFTTDLRLANPAVETAKVTLIFTPTGSNGLTDFAAVNIDIPPGQVYAVDDLVGSAFGTAGTGQLEIDGPVVVASRTYTRTPSGGTVGEVIPPAEGQRHGVVIGLYNTAAFRSNIGFAETGGEGGRLLVSLIDAATGTLAKIATYDIAPYGHMQVPATASPEMILSFIATTDVIAYASIIDNVTEDALYRTVGSSRPRLGLAPAINGAGANGAQWTTDMWIAVPLFTDSPLPVAEKITYQREPGLRSTVDIPWAHETLLEDLVRQTFNAPGTYGVLSTELSQSPAIKSVAVNNGGLHESVTFLEALPDVQDIPFIEVSDAYRTNVGLMSDTKSSIRVVVFDAAGHEIDSSVHELGPLQLDQFRIQPRVVNGFVRIIPISGRAAAYASVIDNISGDAGFVAAQPADPGLAPQR